MKISSFKKSSFRRAILPASIIAAMAMSGSASAFKIDTDNEDLDIRWDNTFRYNAGWRAQDQSADLVNPANPAAAWASDKKFKNGDMVTNRLDLLSEFDFIYKKNSGFRVSAAGWYDQVYASGHERDNAHFFPGGTYPDEIKRYYNGPSGEFLDAFLFTKFDLGNVPVNVKAGQHTIYWGETLFSLADGVSAGQSYADLRKALATPGVEAKEVFKPLNQFSFSAQISPEFTVMGQYFFDFKPDLFPLAGTYFSPADFLTYQGSTAIPQLGFWDGQHNLGLKKSGDWGLAAKWRPEWLDGTAGLYYREYTAKNGGALGVNGTNFVSGVAASGAFGAGLQALALSGTVPAPGPAFAGLYIDGGAPRTKLIGVSLAKQMMGISFGMDLTYRKDATLATKPFAFVNTNNPILGLLGGAIGSNVPYTGWAPIGDIYTGVFNMIAYDGKRDVFGLPLYDSAVFIAELDGDVLDKITRNKQNAGSKANCITGTNLLNAGSASQGYYGCFTNNSYGINISFEPKWFQVLPGTDLTMPIYYGVGLHGNSTVNAVGQNEGMGSYSIGLAADVDAKYNFALKYNGFIYKRVASRNGNFPISNAALGDFSDRNWVSLTAKATW